MSLIVASMSSTAVESRSATSGRPASRAVLSRRQSDREQALDHEVVQIAPDPVAVLEDSQQRLVFLGSGDLHGKRSLLGEGDGQLWVDVVEDVRVAPAPADGQHALAPRAPCAAGCSMAGPSSGQSSGRSRSW